MSNSHTKHPSATTSGGGGKKTTSASGGVSSGGGPPTARSSAILNSTAHNSRKIFVGGLHYGTVDSGLKRYFSSFGTVESAQVMYNRDTAKSRGFGFVVFTDEDAVDRVLEAGTYHEIDDKEVEIKRSVPKSAAAPLPSSTPGSSKAISAPAASHTQTHGHAPAPAPVSAPAAVPVPVAAPAPAAAPVSAPAADGKPGMAWKNKKETAAVVASKPVTKGTSWVSAVVGTSSTHADSGTTAQPAHHGTPASSTTTTPATGAPAPAHQAPAPAPSLAPEKPVSVPHAPAMTSAPVTALGLGMDLSVGSSSIADLLKSSSLTLPLPTPALASPLPAASLANSAGAIGAAKTDASKTSSPSQPFAYPTAGRLPSELPSLLPLPMRPPHSSSWDLTDGGASASEGGLAFSGGDSVVSTLTTEDAEHEDGKGRRPRAAEPGTLGLGFQTTPYPAGLGQPGVPPLGAAHPGAAGLGMDFSGYLGAGFSPSVFQNPILQSMPSDAQSALLASMAAAALRMYQPWGVPQPPQYPLAPQAPGMGMPGMPPYAPPAGPPGLGPGAPGAPAPARGAEHPPFQPFPTFQRL